MAEKKFEEYMDRLEEIVKILESGKGELDETLSLYQEGVEISKICNEMLDKVEQQVTILSKCDGEITEKNFVEGD